MNNCGAQSKEYLDLIRQCILIGYPAISCGDVAACSWFDFGYAEAIELTKKVNTKDELFFPSIYYVVGFKDSHLNLILHDQSDFFFWQGWRAKLVNGDMVVNEISDEWPVRLPPLGACCVSCDGVKPLQYISNGVARFVDVRDHLDSWVEKMIDFASFRKGSLNKFCPLPSVCNFRLSDGSIEKYTMLSKKIYEEGNNKSTDIIFRPELNEINKGVYWLNIPDFMPGCEGDAEWGVFLDQAKGLESVDVLVLDTRGNQGGSSFYGVELLEAIYGKDYIEWLANSDCKKSYAAWKISPLIFKYIEQVSCCIESAENCPKEFREWINKLKENFTWAWNSGLEWLVEWGREREKLISNPKMLPKVILITRSDCRSACLDFVDIVLQLPGVIHVGQATGADTVYTEQVIVNIENVAELCIPIKMWRNRPRESNQAYIPHVKYEGDINNTAVLRDWILSDVI
ncbi:S41 family peptidase [Chromobacterium vaccinii]|uniref:S41 family peptidase n=1 Tax=Chromobacterium vaccinii TaxID=1108595 RepID=UPI0009E5ABAD|nr:S41 family peptidase [Chromobacterium vaccinii]